MRKNLKLHKWYVCGDSVKMYSVFYLVNDGEYKHKFKGGRSWIYLEYRGQNENWNENIKDPEQKLKIRI